MNHLFISGAAKCADAGLLSSDLTPRSCPEQSDVRARSTELLGISRAAPRVTRAWSVVTGDMMEEINTHIPCKVSAIYTGS